MLLPKYLLDIVRHFILRDGPRPRVVHSNREKVLGRRDFPVSTFVQLFVVLVEPKLEKLPPEIGNVGRGRC